MFRVLQLAPKHKGRAMSTNTPNITPAMRLALEMLNHKGGAIIPTAGRWFAVALEYEAIEISKGTLRRLIDAALVRAITKPSGRVEYVAAGSTAKERTL